MVIIKAKLFVLRKRYKTKDGYEERNSRPSGFMGEIYIGDRFDYCKMTIADGGDIPAQQYSNTEVLFLSGELSLDVIKPKEKFEIKRGNIVIATGIVEEVSEIYVEKKIVKLLKSESNFKEELKKIIDLTSNLENAIIEEGVVEMLDE